MNTADSLAARRESSARANRQPEASLTESLEQLLASSQTVVTKRIDLALLEGGELLARSIKQIALLAAAVAMAIGAVFALTAAAVEFLMPQASLAARLAAFGGFDAVAAAAFVLIAKHLFDPPILARNDPRHHAHAAEHSTARAAEHSTGGN
jgi:hypothetical protein